ncbi:MAG: Gfo/Idh/MocA family oxidoreductase [Candidatus Bathyarchaeia archaeon]
MRLRILVVGTGGWGRQHCISLKAIQRAELVGVVGRNIEKARALGEEMGVKGYASISDAIDETKAEAVTIALAHSAHKPVALEVIEKGLPLYVEKSFGASLDDAQAMLDAARKAGVKLMAGFSQRYEPSYFELARLAREGHIGSLRYVFAKRQSSQGFPEGHWVGDPSIAGGGAVAGWGIHDVDLVLHVASSKPKEVYAMMEFDKKGREIQSHILVRHEGGTISEVGIEYYAFGHDAFAWVLGEKGRIDAERSGKLTIYRQNMPPETKALTRSSSFLTEALAKFVESILEGKDPPIPGEDGVRAWKVVDAAYRSARTGKPIQVA